MVEALALVGGEYSSLDSVLAGCVVLIIGPEGCSDDAGISSAVETG